MDAMRYEPNSTARPDYFAFGVIFSSFSPPSLPPCSRSVSGNGLRGLMGARFEAKPAILKDRKHLSACLRVFFFFFSPFPPPFPWLAMVIKLLQFAKRLSAKTIGSHKAFFFPSPFPLTFARGKVSSSA